MYVPIEAFNILMGVTAGEEIYSQQNITKLLYFLYFY